jgi:2',3'-cyclic-nucleotide 2'-phosphodiesterase (5'-nucleotidase family)
MTWLAGLLTLSSCRNTSEASRDAVQPRSAARPAERSLPQLRLLLVSRLEGVLEPCGCTRKSRGGVDRLATMLRETRTSRVPSLVLAAGDLLFEPSSEPPRELPQDAWRVAALAGVLGGFALDVAAPGSADFAHGGSLLAALAQQSPSTAFLGDNASCAQLRGCSRSVLRSVSGLQVGVTAAMLSGASAADPQEAAALEHEISGLRERGAALVIALVHAADTAATAARTAADIVIYTGPSTLGNHAAVRSGGLWLDGGEHGEGVLSVDLWRLGSSPRSWQLQDAAPPVSAVGDVASAQFRVLDESVPSDPQVKQLRDQLFARINAANAQRPSTPRAVPRGAAEYVGSDTCAACHTQAFFWWRQTPHGRAFDSLIARGRQLDLDCIGCHVTGYDKPGGSTVARLDHFQGVGCESCHGPGSSHADNPQATRTIQRTVPEPICLSCHDADHSDAFRYTQAWASLRTRAHGQREP